MAIVNLTTKISEAIDKSEYTAGIFIDLSKAFDTVDHSIVIEKLKHYGVRGIPLEWFKNYLTERNQIVKFKTTLSDKRKIVCQGPKLQPTGRQCD